LTVGIGFLLSKEVPFVMSMTVCICHPSPAGQITVWEELNKIMVLPINHLH